MDEEMKRILAEATLELIGMEDGEFSNLLDAARQSDLYQMLGYASTAPTLPLEWTDTNSSRLPCAPPKKTTAHGGYSLFDHGFIPASEKPVSTLEEGPWIRATAA